MHIVANGAAKRTPFPLNEQLMLRKKWQIARPHGQRAWRTLFMQVRSQVLTFG